MRIQNAVLVFRVRSNENGDMECVHAESGHPIILAAAIESVRSWKFRPKKVNGELCAIYGTIVLRISCCRKGLKSEILDRIPTEQK